MSTTMTFSARFFVDAASPAARCRSSALHSPRGVVPFIGRHSMRPSSIAKNSSGEAEQMACRPMSTNALHRPPCASSSCAKSDSGSPVNGARSFQVKLIW